MKSQLSRAIQVLASIVSAAALASCASKSVYEPELGRDTIRDVVHSHIRAVSLCYEGAIDARPGAMGKVVGDWDITPDGAVQNVKLDEVDPTLEAIRPCLIKEISGWRFPRSTAKDVTNVRYPFIFDERRPLR